MAVLISFTAGFFALLIGLVLLFRLILSSASKKLLNAGHQHDGLTKKYHDVDISKYSTLMMNIGLITSLAISLLAFEWKTYDEEKVVSLGNLEGAVEEVIEIPPTQQKTPPPPKLVQPEIIEVPDETEIENKVEVDLNVEVDQEMVVEQVLTVEKEPEKEEVVEEVFTIVEEGATPDGGYPAFYEFVKNNLKYPSQARRMNIEGKVYVQFVVDKDGKLNEIKVIKGIGGGCDEEAARVIGLAPKWKAGKQRGKPVKQRIVMPIAFKLG
jgi:periplasmic protein TonB